MKTPYIKPSSRRVRMQAARHLAASELTTIGGAGEGFISLDADGGNLDRIIEEDESGW